MSVPAPLRRLGSVLRYYAGGLWDRLMSDYFTVWAQAIAFKVLVTIIPLLVLGTGIFGLVLRQETPFDTIAGFLRNFLPARQGRELIEILEQLQRVSSTVTFFGALFVVAAVITLFTTVRLVVGLAMGTDRHRLRTLLGGYLFDARMAIQVGLLFLLSFSLTAAASTFGAGSVDVLVGWGMDEALLQRGWRIGVRAASYVVPWVLSWAMFVQLFYFIPSPRPPFKSAAVGAVATAFMFDVGKTGFAMAARALGTFDQYAAADAGDAALGGLGQFFGLILAFVFWVYVSGIILIIGAWIARLHEKRHEPGKSRIRRALNRMVRQRWRQEHPIPKPPPAARAASGDGLAPETEPPRLPSEQRAAARTAAAPLPSPGAPAPSAPPSEPARPA